MLEELARLNEEYERRFGLFVVFVDGRTRAGPARAARAARATRDEELTGLCALCAIARDRWTRTT